MRGYGRPTPGLDHTLEGWSWETIVQALVFYIVIREQSKPRAWLSLLKNAVRWHDFSRHALTLGWYGEFSIFSTFGIRSHPKIAWNLGVRGYQLLAATCPAARNRIWGGNGQLPRPRRVGIPDDAPRPGTVNGDSKMPVVYRLPLLFQLTTMHGTTSMKIAAQCWWLHDDSLGPPNFGLSHLSASNFRSG